MTSDAAAMIHHARRRVPAGSPAGMSGSRLAGVAGCGPAVADDVTVVITVRS